MGSKALTSNGLIRIIKSFSETDFISHPGQEDFLGTDPTASENGDTGNLLCSSKQTHPQASHLF